jgi:DNA-binding NarL/FixJ family response regulator
MAISLIVSGPSRMANEALCDALKHLDENFNIVGSACSSSDLIRLLAEHHPQVAVVSIRLQDGAKAGLKALRESTASNNSTRAVMLLDCSDPELVTDAFSAGARGVVCMTESVQLLGKCIRSVLAGQIWANSSQLLWIVESLRRREPPRIVNADDVPLLTKREEQVVCMVVEGMSNKEISSNLGVSVHTVKNHLFRIYEKLGISSRTELILYALRSRQGSPESYTKPPQAA